MTIEELNDNFAKLPEPKNKKNWNEVRDTMFIHTRGKNPGEILTMRRPNEDPDVQKYRLDTWEPITKGSMNRAIDKLFRIFSSANFSITVSADLSDYLDQKKFSGQYFYSYIQKYVVRRMIEDPNGFLVWLPSGPGVEDPSVKVEVAAELISSGDIVYLSDEAISWVAKEKTRVWVGGQYKEGDIILTLTKEGFYKSTQIGGTGKNRKFILELIYKHDTGILPAIILGGDATDEDFFESYFSAFVPFANESIRQYSDWVGVMTSSCFPYREEVADTCAAPGCRDGIFFDIEKDEERPCKNCKGTGRVISRSPFGVFMRDRGSNPITGTQSEGPMIRFIGPPVDVIKYSGEAWELLLKKAEEALNLNTIQEAQSGEAKRVDREDSYIVLSKISNNIFDEIIYKSLLIIEKYREVVNPIDPIIVKPISFSMKNEDDLLDEVSKLSDKNAPVAFLVEATKDLAKKRFSGNKSLSRMVEILVVYDPIYNTTAKDKLALLGSGVITFSDMIKSLHAYKVLTSLVAESGTVFLEKPLQEIFNALDEKIAGIVAEIDTNNRIPLP